jgi:hypothetical protein
VLKSRLPLERRKAEESYFARCERDDKGHCLPSGQAGGGGSEPPNPENRRFRIDGTVKTASDDVRVVSDLDVTSPERAEEALAWLRGVPERELAKSVVRRVEVYEDPEHVLQRLVEVGIDPEIGGPWGF